MIYEVSFSLQKFSLGGGGGGPALPESFIPQKYVTDESITKCFTSFIHTLKDIYF